MHILGRVTAALVTTVAVMSASVGAGQAAPSASDPYSTKITTKTVVRTPTPIHTDTHVDISVKVTANSPTTPTGEIKLTLHSSTGGGGQARSAAAGPDGWTRTISYNGGTDHVRGPAFPKVGDWLVTAVFTPADDTFRGSRDGWVFEVISGNGGDDNGDDNNDDGGLLPDTGGPALLWLLLGVGLVGAGGAAVVVARRRRESGPSAT
jgi:LPXTG-motif cell wall-anchored protein